MMRQVRLRIPWASLDPTNQKKHLFFGKEKYIVSLSRKAAKVDRKTLSLLKKIMS